MILRVGLTGGIASGKSTVAGMLADRGCFLVDADRVVGELYRPGRRGFEAIVANYGRKILRADGEIDRLRLADLAFATPESARALNELIHPIVMQECDRILADEETRRAGEDFVAVVEATLLLEARGRERYDRVIVVDVPETLQLERGVARGMGESEVTRRMRHQMPRQARLAAADYVVDNSGSPQQTGEEIDRLVALLQRDLETKRRGKPLSSK